MTSIHPMSHNWHLGTAARRAAIVGIGPRALRAGLLAATLGFALGAQAQGAGTVTHLSGTLSVKRADAPPKVLAVKSEIREGDVLSTEDDTYARVKFSDNSEVVLRPNTQLKIESYAFNRAKPDGDNAMFSMLKGGLRAVTGLIGKRNHDKVNFSTSTATIGIRGTHFGALLCQGDCGSIPTTTGQPLANGLHVDVADGAIVLRNGAGEVQIDAGKYGFAASAATPPAQVAPQQGFRVTMPASISKNNNNGQGIGKGKEGECAM